MRQFSIFEPEQIEWAAFAVAPPHFGGRKNRPSGAQAAGIRYERKAQWYMQELYPETYVASPWLIFRPRHEPYPRYCQPDGLIFDIERGEITIVEIKLRHMQEAHTQITGIYHPVLRKIFPTPWIFRHLEVTRFYDAAVPFPTRIQLVSDPSLTPKNVFGVHIYR